MPKHGTGVTINEISSLISSVVALLESAQYDLTKSQALQRVLELTENDHDGLVNLKDISELVFMCFKFYSDEDTEEYCQFISQVNMPTDANSELIELIFEARMANLSQLKVGDELIIALLGLQNTAVKDVPGVDAIRKGLQDRISLHINSVLSNCSAKVIQQVLLQCPELSEFIDPQNKSMQVVTNDGTYKTVEEVLEQNMYLMDTNAERIETLLKSPRLRAAETFEQIEPFLYMPADIQDILFLDPRFKTILPFLIADESNARLVHLVSTCSDGLFAKVITELQNYISTLINNKDLDAAITMLELAITHRTTLTEEQKREFLSKPVISLSQIALECYDVLATDLMAKAMQLLDLLNDKNIQCQGETLWHLACTSRRESAAILRKYLLQHNVDTKCVDGQNNTGLDAALHRDQKSLRSYYSENVIDAMESNGITPSVQDLEKVLCQIIRTTNDQTKIDLYFAKLRAIPGWNNYDLINDGGEPIWQTALLKSKYYRIADNFACYVKNLELDQEAFFDRITSSEHPGVATKVGTLFADMRLQDPSIFKSTENLFAYLAKRPELCANINANAAGIYSSLLERKENIDGCVRLRPNATTDKGLYDLLNGTNSKDDPIGIAAKNNNFDFYIIILRAFKGHLSNFADISEQIHEVLSAMIAENISIDPMLEYLRKETNTYNPFKAWRCLSFEAQLLNELQAEIAMHNVVQRGKLKLSM